MKDFKIEVKNQEESKEAQELLFELGYEWMGLRGPRYLEMAKGYKYLTAYSHDKRLAQGERGDADKEITLPQLRDIAVLHRNDVRDATHTDQDNWKWFVAKSGNGYVFAAGNAENKQRWDLADLDHADLTPIKKDKDMENLISGEEALSKVHTGNVQYVCLTNPVKDQWTTITDHFWDQYHLGVFLNKDTTWRFRLKPRTIKIGDIEVPAPFEPKGGERYYFLHSLNELGYLSGNYQKNINIDKTFAQYGAWRTESEIKQVVAALRKLIGVAK